MRTLFVCSFLLTIAACGGSSNTIECAVASECNSHPFAQCAPASSGKMYCQYGGEFATGCPSGLRWSGQAGEGLADSCVAEADGGIPDAGTDGRTDATPPNWTLNVMVGGSGTGSVTSSPAGINCGTACTMSYVDGALVELTATAGGGGSSFLGWSGACAGTATCKVTMTSNKEVGALFGVPGENLWLKQIGTSGADSVAAATRDPDGNIVAVGAIGANVSLDGISLMVSGVDDAFVAKFSALDGHAIWAKRLGGTMSDTATSVAVDPAGNVIVAGSFRGSANFGGGMVTSAGESDTFIAKLNGSSGDHIWSQRFGTAGLDNGAAIAVDTNGDVFASGDMTTSGLNLGGSDLTNSGGHDFYLAKFSGADGSHIWSRSVGGAGDDGAGGIAVDNSGNLVVAGHFAQSVNFGDGVAATAGGFGDVFVAKYAGNNGNHLFHETFGSSHFDGAGALAIDATGAIYVFGTFEGTVSFGGPSPLVSTSGSDLFLVKLSTAGAHLWSKAFTATVSENGHGVALDGTGNVVISGDFTGSIGFGGSMLSSAGNSDAYLARFKGADGSHLGSIRLGGTGFESATMAIAGAGGEVYSVGDFSGFAEFGGVALTSAGNYDGYLLATAPF
jgi:hypothetical protein